MVNYKEEIAKIIAGQVSELSEEDALELVEIPQDPAMGDYAFPCFRLAKLLRKAPQSIAADIAQAIADRPLFEKVEHRQAFPYRPYPQYRDREFHQSDLPGTGLQGQTAESCGRLRHSVRENDRRIPALGE